MVNEGLLLVGAAAFANGRQRTIDTFGRWRRRNTGPLPEPLQVAGFVADGLEHGQAEVKHSDLARRADPTPIEPIVAMVSALAALLRHIGVGRTHKGTHVILLIQDLNVRVVNVVTGELLRELTIDLNRDYQPRK